MSKLLVNIIIPIYKTTLNADDRIALNRCCTVLSAYPITFVKPANLDISLLVKEYPQIQIESFSDTYFEDIVAYNRLMLSTEFYKRFDAYEYILIYQLDAYVFEDSLATWCAKGYDYVGAPWVLKKKYEYTWGVFLFELKYIWYFMLRKPFRLRLLGNKVGNGGFSLRKISSHIAATEKYADLILQYVEGSQHQTIFNEDVFFATQVPDFRFPKHIEALQFAFDLHPARCFKYNQKQLPFGCHGWNKKERRSFWINYINELKNKHAHRL